MRLFRKIFNRESGQVVPEIKLSNGAKLSKLEDFCSDLQSTIMQDDALGTLIMNSALSVKEVIESIEKADKASAKLVEYLSTNSDPYSRDANELKSKFYDEANLLMVTRDELKGLRKQIESESNRLDGMSKPKSLFGIIMQNIANFFAVLFGAETDKSDLKNKIDLIAQFKTIENQIQVQDLEVEIKDIFNSVQAQFTFNDRLEIFSSLQTNISPQIVAYHKSYQDPDMQQMLAANVFDKATGYLTDDFSQVLNQISQHEDIDYRNHEIRRLNGSVNRLEQELLVFKSQIDQDKIVPLDSYFKPYDFSEFESAIKDAKTLLAAKASEFDLTLNEKSSPNLMDKFSALLADETSVKLNIKQNIFDDFMDTEFVPKSHRFEEAVTRQKSVEETKEEVLGI
jgi:hypothetical protein